MAWIESHQSLGAHPKTKKLARLLNISAPTAIGHLHMLWWWALDYAQDGDLSKYQAEDIADAVLWDGSASLLMASLLDAGFLDQPDGNPRIHDWDEYGGKLLAKRKADAERKAKAARPAEFQGSSVGVPAEFRRQSQVDKSTVHTVQEKREENRERAPTPRARARAPKVDLVSLTEDERQELITKWGGKLTAVEDRIATALEHDQHWRYPTGQKRYVDNWLRNDWERGNVNGTRPNTAHRGDSQQDPELQRLRALGIIIE